MLTGSVVPAPGARTGAAGTVAPKDFAAPAAAALLFLLNGL